MNNCSVSMNKNIPENGKMETKSKSSKSEDSFKDMIKNVSNKKTSDKSDQVTKKEKGTGLETSSRVTEGSEETKDNKGDLNDLVSLVINLGGVFDPTQLTKMVDLSAEGQMDADSLTSEQGGAVQAALVEFVAQDGTNLESLQNVSIMEEMPKMQLGEKAPVVYAAQVLAENESDETSSALLKQNVASNFVENASNETTVLKQEAFLNGQNNEGELSQGNEGMDNSSNITSDLQLLSTDSKNDNVITIKVGDASLNSSWEQVAKEIGNMIVEKVNNEIQKVNIKLNPKDLGEIDVEFSINHGKISVSLNCSNEETKTLLSTNLDSLSKVVQSSLMQEVNVNVNYEKADAQNANSENFDGRGQGQYQGNSNDRNKDQEQSDLDFAQRLRIGIENIDGTEV